MYVIRLALGGFCDDRYPIVARKIQDTMLGGTLCGGEWSSTRNTHIMVAGYSAGSTYECFH
jgi:hypothetical protein